MKSFPSHAMANQRCEEQREKACEFQQECEGEPWRAKAPLATARTERCDEQCEVERRLLASSGSTAKGSAGAITL